MKFHARGAGRWGHQHGGKVNGIPSCATPANAQEKEKVLQESIAKQNDLEQKLFNLNLMEFKQKQENERLLKVCLSIFHMFMRIHGQISKIKHNSYALILAN